MSNVTRGFKLKAQRIALLPVFAMQLRHVSGQTSASVAAASNLPFLHRLLVTVTDRAGDG
jgi:hypothetical protein